MSVAQGCELRARIGEAPASAHSSALQDTIADIRRHSDFIDEDRMLEPDLRELTGAVQQQQIRVCA
jgi:histidine ammonia-lyase